MTVDHQGTRETVTADHYVAAMPVEQLRALVSPALAAAEPRLSADPPAAHALDERDHVLPAPRRADPRRPHDLQRLRLGADLDLPAPVLAAHRLRAAGRRARRRDPLGRRLRLGAARRGARARSPRSAPPTRSRPRSGRSSRTTSTTAGTSSSTTPTSHSAFLDEDITFPNPSAAANAEPLLINTAGLVGRPARRGDARAQPLPRLGLRAHLHRPRDDGGRQRGGAARGQRASSTPPTRAPRAATSGSCREPALFGPARALDRMRWKLGHRPAKPPLRVTADGGLEPVGLAGRLLVRCAAAGARPGCRRPR